MSEDWKDDGALERIAIIGMAGRFPGAVDLDAFWRLLRDGVEAIRFFSDDELRAQGVAEATLKNLKYVRAHGTLEGCDLFDAAFFDVSPREAEVMDPQQRLFLETAWEALERAGYEPRRVPGPVGVFGGVTFSTYLTVNLSSHPDLMRAVGGYQVGLGTDKDFLTTRVSYKLDLKGPSLDVQTACSTSLVAVTLACQSLLSYQCDMALAGGSSVRFPQVKGYHYQEGGLDSSDGHCRAFDKKGDGAVYGSGVGVVVLKRLEDALEDGDPIDAVILGAAINNDGSAKVGFTAPSVDGQSEVIANAHALAGVAPETIGYVEAHGTGTALGDPIEVTALDRAFRAGADGDLEPGSCALGSVKTNVGHLSAAAGSAGLIKTVLALKHRQIPPSLHFEIPNPQIDFAATPFFVNDRLRDWEAKDGAPRRAGVSAFGLGGTNAHLVVEEAPEPEPSGPSRPWQLLVLSARSESALGKMSERLAEALTDDVVLADAAWTLQVGRRRFAHRRTVVCRDGDLEAARRALREPGGRREEAEGRPVGFFFPGTVGLEKLQELARRWTAWGIHPEAVAGSGPGLWAAAAAAGVLGDDTAADLAACPGPGDAAGLLRDALLRPPRIPLASARTGTWVTSDEATDPDFWSRELAAADEGKARALLGEGRRVVLELTDGGDEEVLATLGELWTEGVDVDWTAFAAGERRRRLALPTYPFERRRFWVEPNREAAAARAGDADRPRPWRLLGFASPAAEGLEELSDQVVAVLQGRPDLHPDDVATTLRLEHGTGPHRRTLACQDLAEAAKLLAGRDPRRVWSGEAPAAGRGVVFLFSGLGDHYVQMGRDLYENEPVFRAAVDRAAVLAEPEVGFDLRQVLYPGDPPERRGGDTLRRMLRRGGGADAGSGELDRTAIVQPALFVVELALAELLTAWGVRPRAVAGYSLGEYTAAAFAGVLPLDEALRLVARRARLIEELEEGAMLAVPLEASELLPRLGDELDLAAVNGPHLSVAAGPSSAVDALAAELEEEGVPCRRLATRHAFHSRLMEPVAGRLTELARELRPRPPRTALLSNLTGRWLTPEEAVDPGYWARHLCGTVRFSEGLEALWGESPVLLEVGPGQGLTSLALQHPAAPAEAGLALPTLRNRFESRDDREVLLTTVGRAWLAGVEVDWRAVTAGHGGRRLALDGAGAEAAAAPRPSKALAARHARPELATPWAAATGEVEETLARMWQDLLGIEGVGVHDSFFELGGHSLQGTLLLSRVRDTFGVELPLASLFEGPTVSELAAAIAALRSPGAGPGAAAIARRGDPERPVPLSFAQRRLWFLQRLEPGNPFYNLPHQVRLQGELDVPRLRAAVQAVVDRHESLRTSFFDEGGEPRQRVVPSLDFELPVVDLAPLPEEDREARLRDLARRDAVSPFDFSRAPLLRVTLVRLAPDDHVLLSCQHHVVSDGWSTGLLVRDVATTYASGDVGVLPELPVQYPDYALWQLDHLAGEVLEGHLAFWRRHLGGEPLFELPADRPRPPAVTYRGALRHERMSPELGTAVAEFSRARGVSPYMTLLAGFDALLARTAGQRDVVVGTPIANRPRRELENLIGFFVNTLVLRVDVSPEAGFGDLVARVREVSLAVHEHQELPFEKLVEELHPRRDLSRNPLFQVMFNFLNQPYERMDVEGLALSPYAPPGGGPSGAGPAVRPSLFDLTLYLRELPDGALLGGWEYSTDLFDATTVKRLARRYAALLAAALEAPERPLAELDVLAPAERQQLLREWNDTAAPAPGRTLPELLATRPAGAVALSDGVRRWTYGELRVRAAAVAERLRRHGAGPGVRVAISVPRSPEMVAALLGVLEAGASYVPIDPDYPKERRAWVLADAGVRVVIAGTAAKGDLPETTAEVLDLDELTALPDREAPSAQPPGLDAPAYVIYTSGSTGKPKGVEVTHRNLVNFLLAMAERPGFGAQDVLLAVTSLSFDIAGLELWLPLLVGGRLELADAETAGDGGLLRKRLEASGATVLQATPATWKMLLAAGWVSDSGLRMLVGGEALPSDLASRLGKPLWNMYGPTETTVWSSVDRVGKAITLGRPIRSTTLRVVDTTLRPVPIGVSGELLIGGDGVAAGYVGRPALTAERFVPDPWAEGLWTGGRRLYRTGDRVRWLADGRLEFQGRFDHQVKVRGFRIELGEIESVLSRHPAIAELAVVAQGSGGEARLVAWVVPRGEMPAIDDLKVFARRELPEYMVPSVFAEIEALPLTPNRKVDRKALTARDPGVSSEREYVAPRSATEAKLAEIYAEVLRVPRVGALDDFFELGGHSLLGTMLLARVRDAFGVELPLRRLFEGPTVAALARALAEAGPEVGPPPIARAPRDGRALPLSFAQRRVWFLQQLEPQSPFYNLPYPVRFGGVLDVSRLFAAVQAAVDRHESLRTAFRDDGGEPSQVVVPSLAFDLPLIDLSGLPPERREKCLAPLARRDAARPFDLARAPLLRMTLVRLAAADHALLVNVHHTVSDYWSIGLLVRDVATAYAGRALTEPEVQYADYAAWQKEWLTGEVLDAHLGFWRDHLAGEPLFELPADRPRPPVQTFRGAMWNERLPADLGREVAAFSRARGVSPYMTLLAAFDALLARTGGQRDVVVGTPVANRSRRELEELVGFFVNTLVLRVDVSPEAGFGDLVSRVREVSLAVHEHQELPFEKLVEELHPRRDLSRNPLFQVMFNFLNQPYERMTAEGLSVGPLHPPEAAPAVRPSLFDLTLYLREAPGGSLLGGWEYSTDLFDATTVRRLARRFAALLRAALAAPALPLSDLDVLAPAEGQQLLREWNDTAAPAPEQTLPEAMASRRGSAVAVSDGDRAWTWDELGERVASAAGALAAHGVGPGTRVAISAPRSLETVAALLGVLRAGAAYVPVDPAYPKERRAWVLEDAGVRVVAADAAARGDLPETSAEVVALEKVFNGPVAEMAFPPLDAPAYVIYTSGSTGKPKGVEVTHRNLVNFLLAMAERPGFSQGDVLLAVTSLSFDIAGLELWLPLLCGGRLELADAETAGDGGLLRKRLEASGATVLQATPATWKMLLAAGWEPSADLRMLVGGEALPAELAARLAPELWNMYGPTETTVWSSVDRVREAITLGRPIRSTTLRVVDAALRPVPVGVSGELLIGGDGVAAGYVGRPALTAERFVPDPWAEGLWTGGRRLYRTGDRVRWLADGRLEFQGRFDHQVKVRGFRIELGEIESVLSRHPAIAELAVVAQGSGGEARLVAWVVPRGEMPAVDDLKAFARRELPEYMVPSVFAEIEALPLTPNRKVDRKVLMARDPGVSSEREYVAPRSATEAKLAEIYASVLRVPRVGVLDDFFELGGHSLLATQVTSRLRDAFGVELPVRSLFEDATVAGLAARVATAGRAGEGPVPVPRSAEMPLSFAQERLWFLSRLAPDNPFYNLPQRVELEGPLDAGRLRNALRAVAERHETLRTCLRETGGRPYQTISAEPEVELPLVDLSRLDPEHRDRLAAAFARREAVMPFDLTTAPLVRALLLRLEPRRHLLLATIHHVVSDAWSSGLLTRDVAMAYGGRAVEPLRVQYADYAAWQRRRLSGEALEAEVSYWRSRLAGEPLLELPTDRPRPPVQTYRGAAVSRRLPPELGAAAAALGREHGASLNMVLLAAFEGLLARFSGQRDVVLGTPVANRPRRELEDLIGFFVNTLVLRVGVHPGRGFATLLDDTRETALSAFEHQELPFEKLVEELKPRRDLSRNPLFQVMFNFLNPPTERLQEGELRIAPYRAASSVRPALFDLQVYLVETPGGVAMEWEYATALYDRTTVERLARHFEGLLRQALADPERPLAELALASPGERHQVVVEWNDTAVRRAAPDATLTGLLEAQAARTPDAPALVFDGEDAQVRLTYRELFAAADGLAWKLRELGVGQAGTETLVGVALERSAELLVALLAVLKAGGAYVPLDPSYPRERLAFMVEDAGAPVLLTTRRLSEELADALVGPVHVLVDGEPPAAVAVAGPPPRSTDPESPAYTIYTSGSTGQPKGATNRHRGIVNRLLWMQETYGLAPGDRVVQKTPVSFDVSVWELFGPFLAGATLVVAKPEGHRDSAYLLGLVERERITAMHFVPPMLQLFLEERDVSRAAASLRRVTTSGEALQADVERRFAERLPGVELLNLYGPTEAAIEVTYHLATGAGDRPVPIGRPIANTAIRVLDRGLRPQPIGVAGELLIGGVNLARGYHRRPALTAEKFVPDPFAETPGQRLYKTGDLVRLLGDGTIDFLGRIDHQVKLRGFRIELGEVETALGSLDGVREAVVVVRPVGKDPQLVAYLVADAETPPAEWKEALRHKLPDYMVPAAFVVLGALPLLPNGKVDRRALPAPERPASENEYVAPRSESEGTLAAIFAEVLAAERVGVLDDFFELGGHSLLATQVVSRIRDGFGVALPVRALFEAPTVAQLDEIVLKAQMEVTGDSEVAELLAQLEGMSEEELARLAEEQGET